MTFAVPAVLVPVEPLVEDRRGNLTVRHHHLGLLPTERLGLLFQATGRLFVAGGASFIEVVEELARSPKTTPS